MAKKKKCECPAGEKWAVPYADFLSLLLALFIALYAIASVNISKAKIMSETFRVIFDNAPMVKETPMLPIPLPPGQNRQIDETMKLKIQSSQQEKQQMEEIARNIANLKDAADKEGTGSNTEVIMTDDGVKIRMFEGVIFERGSAAVPIPFKRLLKLYGQIIGQIPNRIKVEGFSTEEDASGSDYPSNWELSGARAAAIVRYFTEEERMDPKRFYFVGNADTKPLNPQDPRSFMNRRVEITIMHYGGIPDQQIPSILDGTIPKLQGGSE